MGFPIQRPRRLRQTAAMRELSTETRLHPANLVLPLFVKEDLASPVPIKSMPGVYQHTLVSLRHAAYEAAAAGVGGVMLFGIPTSKDAIGSAGTDKSGILQLAIKEVVAEVGNKLVVMSDLCLDE